MKTNQLHKWSVSPEEARAIQKNLSAWVVQEGRCKTPSLIARIQLYPGIIEGTEGSEQAAIIVKSYPSQTVIERKVAIRGTSFPRIPGLLSFRKTPAIIAALDKLSHSPDLIICDGRGVTGPESFGVASHVGLITNIPTIGVRPPKPRDSNSLLPEKRGSWLPLKDTEQKCILLRVLEGMDPLLISPAHKIGFEEAAIRMLEYLPANTPSRQYLEMLYPERYTQLDDNIPILRVVNDPGR